MNYLTLQNQCFSGLFADEAVAQEFGAAAMPGRFLAFEIALTPALAGAGVLEPRTAAAAVDQMHSFHPDLGAVARATGVDGLPVPEFARQLKSHVGADLADAVLAGATSQDLIDTAMVLALKELNLLLADTAETGDCQSGRTERGAGEQCADGAHQDAGGTAHYRRRSHSDLADTI